MKRKRLFFQPFKLHFVIVRVDSAFFHQLLVGTAFGDVLIIDDDDLVGVPDGGQPVGDGDGGTVFRQLLQTLLDVALAFIIKGAGGLVQDQDGRIF